jgi:DNA repair protein RecN (Recombination protein N)
MLRTLHITNYAIIDEIGIDFSSRLNVITGETGAGKSILMGALSLILGDRADTSFLLNREKKCIVEGTFSADNSSRLKQLLADNDLEGGEEIIIRREIAANGKSRAFVNDTPVNLEQLRQISSLLVDLHRQFDTLSLSDAAFQRDVLDALADNAAILQKYQSIFREWKASQEVLNELHIQKTSFNKEYDYNKFLFDELEQAAFADNELEDADAELKILSHAGDIKSGLTQVSETLSGGDQPLVQRIKSMQHQLEGFARYHNGVEDLLKRLQSVQIELQDIANEVDRLNDNVAHDPSRIEQLNERTALGYKLLKKHGVQTTAELLSLQKEFEEKLQAVMNIDEHIAKKEKETSLLLKQLEESAGKLSEKRNKQIRPLEEKVNRLLVQVGMPNARLKVSMENKPADLYGNDAVEFLFDANQTSGQAGKNNRFEPIRKVASGGELSRLMLSIKSLVAESMDLPTLIFDEIDTGISGEAAKQVGAIMSELAQKRQVITITHQPQIAGKANTHLFVYKDIRNDAIRTNIRQLSGEERITVIARMLSGEKPTAAALENAREMVMN